MMGCAKWCEREVKLVAGETDPVTGNRMEKVGSTPYWWVSCIMMGYGCVIIFNCFLQLFMLSKPPSNMIFKTKYTIKATDPEEK